MSIKIKCPGLALVDFTMPEMDGFEFIKNSRSFAECHSTKVVLISGWDDLAKRAKDCGANGCLWGCLDDHQINFC